MADALERRATGPRGLTSETPEKPVPGLRGDLEAEADANDPASPPRAKGRGTGLFGVLETTRGVNDY